MFITKSIFAGMALLKTENGWTMELPPGIHDPCQTTQLVQLNTRLDEARLWQDLNAALITGSKQCHDEATH